MSSRKYHNRSVSDKLTAKQSFSGRTSADFILRQFRNGQIDRETAQKNLRAVSLQGMLWAGELAIEGAHKTADDQAVLGHINTARSLFTGIVEQGQMVGQSSVDAVSVQAEVQLAHLPLQAWLRLEGQLPSETAAQKAYQRTVQASRKLAVAYKESIGSPSRRESKYTHMSGLAGELAVLNLLERSAINRSETGFRFPFLSTISEDRKNSHGSAVNHSWDVSLFTSDEGKPALTDRIQVKTCDTSAHNFAAEHELGISLVCVDPDLKINSYESFVACRIIDECFFELEAPDMYTDVADRLNVRTEKLLYRIAAAAA